MNTIIHQRQALCRIALDHTVATKDRVFLARFYALDPHADWQLSLTEEQVYRLSNHHLDLALCLDFRTGNYRHRQQHQGKEPLLKAIRVRGKLPKTLIDATPGLLKDSLMLAGHGINITAIERNPLLYVMVKQALSHVNVNVGYHFGEAKCLLPDYHAEVIYLDPMYPAKKSSAQVKKDMQILHAVIGADGDAAALLGIACQQSARVIVKRPSYAEHLGKASPTFSYAAQKRKATRFDVYLPHVVKAQNISQ